MKAGPVVGNGSRRRATVDERRLGCSGRRKQQATAIFNHRNPLFPFLTAVAVPAGAQIATGDTTGLDPAADRITNESTRFARDGKTGTQPSA